MIDISYNKASLMRSLRSGERRSGKTISNSINKLPFPLPSVVGIPSPKTTFLYDGYTENISVYVIYEKLLLPMSFIGIDSNRPSSVGTSTEQPTNALPSGILALYTKSSPCLLNSSWSFSFNI